ncbi:MAG: TfoX/Sxy family protein [Saprospiraceae bacterium]
MPYSEFLADRIRMQLRDKQVSFEEKKMMGGLCFMVNDKMCVGVDKENLMARIGPEAYPDALEKKGCSEMDLTGKPLKGFVFIDAEGVDTDKELAYWIQLCIEFNPRAKASKKTKKP